MKKTSKKVLSVVLVVMLLCSMLSITALATDPPAEPSVTVYITKNLFDAGGYDFDEHEPLLQTYIGDTITINDYFNDQLTLPSGQYFSAQTIKISDITDA